MACAAETTCDGPNKPVHQCSSSEFVKDIVFQTQMNQYICLMPHVVTCIDFLQTCFCNDFQNDGHSLPRKS